MAITESDIKLLKSARMNDTADGGGQMTGNVVQSGVDNNIFDDVSALDRVYGNVSLRKVFPAVLTNTTDKFLGARVIIDKPPADEYIDGTLFGASSLFDTRAQAQSRVEAYLALGAPYQGLLFGPHIEGMLAITIMQSENTDLPTVGGVYVLRQTVGAEVREQFVRSTTISSAVVTFTDSNGEFRKRIVTLGTADALRYDFTGFEATRFDSNIDFSGYCRLYNSVVANAAQYYGIKPLDTPATMGSFNIKAASAFSQLLPSAQIEVPISDARTNGAQDVVVPAAGGAVTLTVIPPNATNALYIGTAVTQGSISLVQGAVTATDVGGKLMAGGTEIGVVDHANGIVTASTNTFNRGDTATLTYVPAVQASGTVQSIGQRVTLANRSLSFSFTLPSAPIKGTATFSYMSGGRWYVLQDDGSGAMRGNVTGIGAGVLNSANTLVVSMGALPDVGSALIVSWVTEVSMQALDTIVLRNSGKLFFPIAVGKALVPGAVSLSWSSAGTKTATDNGLGMLTGDATGMVDYQRGIIYVTPNELPSKGTVVTATTDAATTAVVDFSYTNDTSGTAAFTITPAPQPRTVSFVGRFSLSSSDTSAFTGIPANPTTFYVIADIAAQFSDDGVGGIQATFYDTSGAKSIKTVGTINYVNGAVSLNVTSAIFVGFVFNGAACGTSYPYVYFRTTMQAAATLTSSQVLLKNTAGQWATQVGVSFSSTPATSTPATATVEQLFAVAEHVPAGATLGQVSFKLGRPPQTGAAPLRHYSTSSGVLMRYSDAYGASAGGGTAVEVGSVNGATGVVTLDVWTPNEWQPDVRDFRGQFIAPTAGGDAAFQGSRCMFRTPLAPLRPGSLQILGEMADGTPFTVVADSSGKINGARVKGVVDYQVGVVELQFCNPTATNLGTVDVSEWAISGVTTVNVDIARLETLRYNVVGYNYLSLDASILGLDPVRLPSDGRVPVFKSGRVVVVHNTQTLPPQTVSNGQTVNCGRTLLSRIRVFDNGGLEITSGFSKNLDAGTITFTNVAGYSQPVTVEHRIEDEALCADAQITGDMRLTRPLTHSYPAGTSYVSSAYVQGTLQAAAQDVFSQLAWTNVWSDSIIGDPILAQYNDTANPIVVTNAGAITERWAIIFQTNTTFNLVGEEVGVILSGSTGADLAPVNPATGVPYFTLAAAGWGTGWVAGNVLRFNTSGANFPLWVARTVMQSPAAAPGTDQMVISIRGDIDV